MVIAERGRLGFNSKFLIGPVMGSQACNGLRGKQGAAAGGCICRHGPRLSADRPALVRAVGSTT
jgi:hypothetical protein